MKYSRQELNEMHAKFPHQLIQPGRRVGNTTRLVDYYIQELFKKGEVQVIDHYTISKMYPEEEISLGRGGPNEHILNLFMRRLALEGHIIFKVLTDGLRGGMGDFFTFNEGLATFTLGESHRARNWDGHSDEERFKMEEAHRKFEYKVFFGEKEDV